MKKAWIQILFFHFWGIIYAQAVTDKDGNIYKTVTICVQVESAISWL
jgi:hypothetical protein